MHLYSCFIWSICKALRYGPCVTMGSHSFTCYPHTPPHTHTHIWTTPLLPSRLLAGTLCCLNRE